MSHWLPTFDRNNRISPGRVIETINLLKQTAWVHRERDFATDQSAAVLRKVNYTRWMRIMCRHNDGGFIDVVIFYHLMQHREKMNRPGKWSISVGFHQSLLGDPDPTRSVDDIDYEFVPFVLALNSQIKQHCREVVAEHDHARVVWVDDQKGTAETRESEQDRRRTKIGEVAWVAENNSIMKDVWRFHCSRIANECKWGRPHDTYMDLTVARLKNP